MPVSLYYTQKVRGFQQEQVKYSTKSVEIRLKRTKHLEGALILRNSSLKLKLVVDNAILLNISYSSENIFDSIKIKTENGFYPKLNV